MISTIHLICTGSRINNTYSQLRKYETFWCNYSSGNMNFSAAPSIAVVFKYPMIHWNGQWLFNLNKYVWTNDCLKGFKRQKPCFACKLLINVQRFYCFMYFELLHTQYTERDGRVPIFEQEKSSNNFSFYCSLLYCYLIKVHTQGIYENKKKKKGRKKEKKSSLISLTTSTINALVLNKRERKPRTTPLPWAWLTQDDKTSHQLRWLECNRSFTNFSPWSLIPCVGCTILQSGFI